MKVFVIVAALAVAAVAEKLDNTYLPPGSARTAGGNGNFLAAPVRPSSHSAPAPLVRTGPVQPQPQIVRLNNENPGDGTYRFDFETENKINQHEQGELKNAGTDQESNVVQGSYSYTGPDGVTYTINYVADENGFRADGAHLPVAPEVPQEIQVALQKNAADEAAGIVDDGQYRPEPAPATAYKASADFGVFKNADSGFGRPTIPAAPSRKYVPGGYRY